MASHSTLHYCSAMYLIVVGLVHERCATVRRLHLLVDLLMEGAIVVGVGPRRAITVLLPHGERRHVRVRGGVRSTVEEGRLVERQANRHGIYRAVPALHLREAITQRDHRAVDARVAPSAIGARVVARVTLRAAAVVEGSNTVGLLNHVRDLLSGHELTHSAGVEGSTVQAQRGCVVTGRVVAPVLTRVCPCAVQASVVPPLAIHAARLHNRSIAIGFHQRGRDLHRTIVKARCVRVQCSVVDAERNCAVAERVVLAHIAGVAPRAVDARVIDRHTV